MTITLVLIVISILVLAFFLFRGVRGRGAQVRDIAELHDMTETVNLLAFRNLTSPIEEQYLREHLAPRQFRSVQRQRLLAAIAYLDCVSANSAVLLRLGEAARHSPESHVAEAGLLLVNDAWRVRLCAVSARLRLYIAILFPGLHVAPSAVCDGYEKLTRAVQRLGRLHTASLKRC